MSVPFKDCPFASYVGDGLSRIDPKHTRFFQVTSDAVASLSSVDIDEACRTTYPNARRWDYGIWVTMRAGTRQDRVSFVEIHKAETGEVSVVMEKKRWLLDLLMGVHLPPQTWYWVPTGKILIPKMSAQYRNLAIHHIKIAYSIKIPECV